MLDNLVSNALKFTPEGGRVEVRTSVTDDNVRIEVEDTGIGIPADDQPRLFERFFRSAVGNRAGDSWHGARARDREGDRRGARGPDRESQQQGKGTTFRVELPFREVRVREPVEEAA